MTQTLILGATGFIGSHIARACLEAGMQVRILRRPTSSFLALHGIENDLEFATGDLADRDSLERAMAGCKIVYHAAGYYPTRSVGRDPMRHAAMQQMRNVLESARATGVEKIIYTSSLATIGPPSNPDGLARETERFPGGIAHHPYWNIKRVQENIARRYHEQGLPIVILNPTMVFGPGDAKPVTGQLLLGALRLRCRFYVDLRTNVVDVRDVAAAHVAAVERGLPGERYTIGGANIDARELLSTLAATEGLPPPHFRLPVPRRLFWPARLFEKLSHHLAPQQSFVMPTYGLEWVRLGSWFDDSKARQTLAWQPTYCLAETLADAVGWFRQHGYL